MVTLNSDWRSEEMEKEPVKLQVKKRFFNEVYLPTLKNTSRQLLFYGGAGSGKSVWMVIRQILIYMRSPEPRKCLVVRKVGATIRESIFAEFKKNLSALQILDYCKVSESNFTITLPNGSQFIFKPMDDPEKIKSISGIDDIMIEEATELTLDDFSQLNLRLRSNKPNNQIIMAFNPVSKSNWIYKNYFEGNPELKDTTIIHTTYKDNKFLPQSYIDALHDMMRTNEAYYKIYALGEFASLGKLVFSNWKEEHFDPFELAQDGLIPRFGLDFGFSADPSTLVCTLVDRANKKIYVFDEMYQKSMTNIEIFEEINSRGYTKAEIIADSSEPKSIEELKRYGLRKIKASKKGNDSVLWGINFIQGYEIIVHPRCKNFIDELQNYEYQKDKKTNEYINKPIDAFNHLMDALRYALEPEMPRNRMSTMQKVALGI
ncbi:PBSX family phage terminase large subunit [Bacillus cereus]|nr:PBSX family phage terminase large subunit [Bacillus cereus]ARO65067.1 PBSX family phage terminase large subunit [Bacillus cereus]